MTWTIRSPRPLPFTPRHAAALHADGVAVLRARRDAHVVVLEQPARVQVRTKRRLGHRNLDLAVEVVAVAVHELVRLDPHGHDQIAGRRTADSRLAHATDPHLLPIRDASGDVDLDALAVRNPPRTLALRARVLDDLPRGAAVVARRHGLHRAEEGLAHRDALTGPVAHRAGDYLSALGRARPAADIARGEAVEHDLLVRARAQRPRA